MTRETKIGLLVGLAFIIVIGILLSDHLTSSTEPPPATLAKAGDNVRQTVGTPGGTQAPITPVVAPLTVTPVVTVPTRRDLQQPTNATSVVQVGGPSISTGATQQPQPPITMIGEQSQQSQPTMQQSTTGQPIIATSAPNATQSQQVQQNEPEQQVAGADAPNNPIAQVAQQHGEALVTVTPNGQTQLLQTNPGTTTTSTRTNSGSMKDYVAEPGDSVSKMAAKFFSTSTKASRDAIIRANPSLAQDPDKVIVGKTYKIPASIGTAVASSAGQPAITNSNSQQQQQQQTVATVASSTEYWYTVKEGDSLWRIANDQLGKGGAAVAAIKELNKDVLKNGDTVVIGQKLRLPGKPVAQAN